MRLPSVCAQNIILGRAWSYSRPSSIHLESFRGLSSKGRLNPAARKIDLGKGEVVET